MFSNDTERTIFVAIFTTVLVLFVVCSVALCMIRARDRSPSHEHDAATGTSATGSDHDSHMQRTLGSHVGKPPRPKPVISSPRGFRPLRMAEKNEVESVEKRTVAQARRNAMECSGAIER